MLLVCVRKMFFLRLVFKTIKSLQEGEEYLNSVNRANNLFTKYNGEKKFTFYKIWNPVELFLEIVSEATASRCSSK